MSFYVDANEQRQKARWAEQRLQEHTALRQPRRGPALEADLDPSTPESALPPVFRTHEGYANAREPSVDRRAARFRDTHIYGPPPPPPARADDIQRVLPPKRWLVPQDVANMGITNDPRYAVQPTPTPEYTAIAHRFTDDPPPPPSTEGGIPALQPFTPALPPTPAHIPQEIQELVGQHLGLTLPPDPPVPTGGLTPSQKKRLRRKKAKLARTTPPSPAPYPLPQDRNGGPHVARAPSTTNGHTPTPTPALVEPTVPDAPLPRRACGHEVVVQLRVQGLAVHHRLVCPLSPWPHPGQPHLLKLDPAPEQPDGTEIFVGWWGPGE